MRCDELDQGLLCDVEPTACFVVQCDNVDTKREIHIGVRVKQEKACERGRQGKVQGDSRDSID